MQRCTTLETTHIHTTCVHVPQTPNKEPPHGLQIAMESPPRHTSLGAHVQTPHHSLSVHTHPSRVDPHETDTMLNLFGFWEVVQDQRSYALLMKTSLPPLPLLPTPDILPQAAWCPVPFHRGREGGQWRDGMRRGTEPLTPKVQQKRLFCFPNQEVQKGLHPAQPPTTHPQCSVTCLDSQAPVPRSQNGKGGGQI